MYYFFVYSIHGLASTTPPGLNVSAMKDDPTRAGVKFWDMTWTPTAKDRGANILCGIVDDTLG